MKDVRHLFMLAFPGPPNYMSKLMARDAFIDALSDRELMIKVMEREPGTLDQAYKIAERLELNQKIPSGSEGFNIPKSGSKVRGTTVEDNDVLQSIIETQQKMQKQLSSLTEALKERPSNQRNGGPVKAPSSKLEGVCHHCHKPGHFRPQCPDLVKVSMDLAAAGSVKKNVTCRGTTGQEMSKSSVTLSAKEGVQDSTSTLESAGEGGHSGQAVNLEAFGSPFDSSWFEYMKKYPSPPLSVPLRPTVPLRPSAPLRPSVHYDHRSRHIKMSRGKMKWKQIRQFRKYVMLETRSS